MGGKDGFSAFFEKERPMAEDWAFLMNGQWRLATATLEQLNNLKWFRNEAKKSNPPPTRTSYSG